MLGVLPAPIAGRVLRLTEADCYAPGLNFFFGQAALDGREAFVALPRLRRSFYGLAEDPDLYRRRPLQECVYEAALPGCPLRDGLYLDCTGFVWSLHQGSRR